MDCKMDGYLDQQVPYTLANVRMEKSVLNARYVLRFGAFWFCFHVVRSRRAPELPALGLRLSRVCTSCVRDECALWLTKNLK